jgi:predicted nucleic acid-binding protein
VNISSKVLVDSSVWIDFFRDGIDHSLTQLIAEDLVCTNDVILTELLPSLTKINSKTAINGLLSIERIPLNIDWRILREYQLTNLENGINKVGIPDLMILQQVIFNKLTLHSLDKHFQLMQMNFTYTLFSNSLL